MTTKKHGRQDIPMLLHDALTEAGIKQVDDWWNGLDDLSQENLIQLWESCADLHFGVDRGEDLPMRMRVVATPQGSESDASGGFWNEDFYDYLVSHEVEYFPTKVFHICTAQPAARQVAERGVIPHDFQCPIADAECLMQSALELSGGRTLRLRLTFVPCEGRQV
jgi:hypothetical protein